MYIHYGIPWRLHKIIIIMKILSLNLINLKSLHRTHFTYIERHTQVFQTVWRFSCSKDYVNLCTYQVGLKLMVKWTFIWGNIALSMYKNVVRAKTTEFIAFKPSFLNWPAMNHCLNVPQDIKTFCFLVVIVLWQTYFFILLYLYRARNKITQLSIPTHAQLQRHRLKFIY